MTQKLDFLNELAIAVLQAEARAIAGLVARIDGTFTHACQLLLQCKGRIIVVGIGKSGHIANKMAATFASTGSPAFFVHPSEASHGDLGMITAQDVLIALSYSGSTHEIITLLPHIQKLQIPLITLTGNPHSPLAKAATANINIGIEKEACPLGLAPTTSTTATLAMGDALAIALLEAKGFTAEDFARSHPGGRLGKKLLLHAEDIMLIGDRIPQVTLTTPLTEAILEITQKGLGFTTVVDHESKLLGIYTDGDLRRTLDKKLDLQATPITEVMTQHCKTIRPKTLVVEALGIMEKNKITSLVITDEENRVIGAVHLHDVLSAGVV